MQAQLLVGPIAPINGSDAFSSLFKTGLLTSTSHRRRSRSAVASAAAINGEQNHYAVLGVAYSATSADIKKAYRLLARKYHPDVSKDSQAGEVFKTICHAYEVLSDEVTRSKYDRALKFQKDTGRSYRGNWSYSPEFDDGVRIYKWAELRRKMQNERYWKGYSNHEEDSSFDDETDEEDEEHLDQERVSFSEVLRSTFISLFILQIFGSRLSLTFSSLTALFDKKLDSGYKMGYLIAWVLGGRGGILLTLCLSFASWVCGKTSSSIVVLVVIAMWFGSNLARCAPLPQGALLALLYMSIKLQVDLS
ncbi:J domain-containing protein DDB_G0295729 [Pistacia vera]|uniref:J domain-containing protein DDB_G0295729 n=1 Tax=Pistacia vera TaxID=55513 RepID=UPI001262E224|nr:J domain-containing protein DDB_G0295729 [Pistacia vera]